ncbi:hypothetical protein BZG36_04367 [Bifiguratus adelaidae]|uniref:WSC domain-containing protein n=1 Tax=Bifiguratus adelaidae TaxID=1938954 RepID=A0A261XVV6_9FUNG|nr:hypothetical protein BZG36_04367 [Bifiguratus adelaidae]
MHPPLAEHKHPACYDLIKALEDCHNSGLFNKFFGGCNQLKLDLNKCLGQEFNEVRAENRRKAQEKRTRCQIAEIFALQTFISLMDDFYTQVPWSPPKDSPPSLYMIFILSGVSVIVMLFNVIYDRSPARRLAVLPNALITLFLSVLWVAVTLYTLYSYQGFDDCNKNASLGCYLDDQYQRDLQYFNESDPYMSISFCRGNCLQLGYPYAGLQNGTQCWCGYHYGTKGASQSCDTHCAGDVVDICGGEYSNNVYYSSLDVGAADSVDCNLTNSIGAFTVIATVTLICSFMLLVGNGRKKGKGLLAGTMPSTYSLEELNNRSQVASQGPAASMNSEPIQHANALNAGQYAQFQSIAQNSAVNETYQNVSVFPLSPPNHVDYMAFATAPSYPGTPFTFHQSLPSYNTPPQNAQSLHLTFPYHPPSASPQTSSVSAQSHWEAIPASQPRPPVAIAAHGQPTVSSQPAGEESSYPPNDKQTMILATAYPNHANGHHPHQVPLSNNPSGYVVYDANGVPHWTPQLPNNAFMWANPPYLLSSLQSPSHLPQQPVQPAVPNDHHQPQHSPPVSVPPTIPENSTPPTQDTEHSMGSDMDATSTAAIPPIASSQVPSPQQRPQPSPTPSLLVSETAPSEGTDDRPIRDINPQQSARRQVKSTITLSRQQLRYAKAPRHRIRPPNAEGNKGSVHCTNLQTCLIFSVMASQLLKSRSIIKTVLSREQPEGAGATVRRSIGRPELRNFDPFLLLDDFTIQPPAGFPDHPHRGFETVTYLLEGEVHHEDHKGHKGKIGPGDLQWMSAGRGILHAEMPGSQKGRGLQLWVNLPAKHKMDEPNYQELLAKDIPQVTPEEGINIKVIAGESYGTKARVVTKTPTMYIDIDMAPGKVVNQSIPADYHGFIYTLNGKALFGDEKKLVESHHTAVLDTSSATNIRIETPSNSSARFVVIAGAPIKEPIVQYGPFVMNTEREIFDAMRDFDKGLNGFEGAKKWQSEIGDMTFKSLLVPNLIVSIIMKVISIIGLLALSQVYAQSMSGPALTTSVKPSRYATIPAPMQSGIGGGSDGSSSTGLNSQYATISLSRAPMSTPAPGGSPGVGGGGGANLGKSNANGNISANETDSEIQMSPEAPLVETSVVKPQSLATLRSLLGSYKDARKAYVRAKDSSDRAIDGGEAYNIIKKIVQMLTPDILRQGLIPILLEVGGLTPANKKKRPSVPHLSLSEEILHIWLPLLWILDDLNDTFMEELCTAMLTRLHPPEELLLSSNFGGPPRFGAQPKPEKEHVSTSHMLSLVAWLKVFIEGYHQATHTIRNPKHPNFLDNLPVDDMLEFCLRNINPYTRVLLQVLAENDRTLLKPIQPFIRYIDKVLTLSPANDSKRQLTEADMERELALLQQECRRITEHKKNTAFDPEAGAFQEDMEMLQDSAWSIFPTNDWKPSPIGCMPDKSFSQLDLPLELDGDVIPM